MLETSDGYVLIDRKSFPGTTEPAWRAKVKGSLPQLAAYAAALDRLDGPPVAGIWVHLPLGGGATNKHLVEMEMRLATEMVAVAGAVRDVAALVREMRAGKITAVERKVG